MPRVYPDNTGGMIIRDGDYGQYSQCMWLVWPPGQHVTGLLDMEVVEHNDGTITVKPPIVINDQSGNELWRGHLINGEWEREMANA